MLINSRCILEPEGLPADLIDRACVKEQRVISLAEIFDLFEEVGVVLQLINHSVCKATWQNHVGKNI